MTQAGMLRGSRERTGSSVISTCIRNADVLETYPTSGEKDSAMPMEDGEKTVKGKER